MRTLYALAVATLIALPLPNAPAMAQAAGLNKTAQACAADYLKVVDNLNACFQTIRTRGDLNAHEAAEEKNTLAAKLAAGQTLTPLEIFQLWKHQLDWGGCYISDTAGNCDPTFGDVDRYREAAASYCMDSALKALSRLAQSCSKGAPTLFAGGGASCQWSGSISTSCHSACGGDMQCNYCDQFDASRANLCSPMEDRGTHKVKLSPQLCPQASRLADSCTKQQCAGKEGLDARNCASNCQAQVDRLFEACNIARYGDPPTGEQKSDSAAHRSSRNVIEKKTTASPDVNSGRTKNNLDRFGLGPTYVDTSSAGVPGRSRGAASAKSAAGTVTKSGMKPTISQDSASPGTSQHKPLVVPAQKEFLGKPIIEPK